MFILLDDKIQYSDADAKLKSPNLQDTYTAAPPYTITLAAASDINCIGVGYTDATQIDVNGEIITLDTDYQNGLYPLTTILPAETTLTIDHDGTYIGRLGAGWYRKIYGSFPREPGFSTTRKPRITASGNVIPSAGGYVGRKFGMDTRYKITDAIFDDIEAAFSSQLSNGYPVFLYFDKETSVKIPWRRLYAAHVGDWTLQSAINAFLYSKRFSFEERF